MGPSEPPRHGEPVKSCIIGANHPPADPLSIEDRRMPENIAVPGIRVKAAEEVLMEAERNNPADYRILLENIDEMLFVRSGDGLAKPCRRICSHKLRFLGARWHAV